MEVDAQENDKMDVNKQRQKSLTRQKATTEALYVRVQNKDSTN